MVVVASRPSAPLEAVVVVVVTNTILVVPLHPDKDLLVVRRVVVVVAQVVWVRRGRAREETVVQELHTQVFSSAEVVEVAGRESLPPAEQQPLVAVMVEMVPLEPLET